MTSCPSLGAPRAASLLLTLVFAGGAGPAAAAFTDATAAYGLVDVDRMSYAATWSDFDGNGTQDLYVGNHWKGPADLYRNDGASGLADDSEHLGVGNSDRHDALWGDFDNDGAPDQYISHGAGYPGTQDKELFWNRGNSVFEEGALAAGVQDPVGRGRELTLADFDNDGWLDLFVTNDFRAGFPKPNRLFFNDGDGTFTQYPNNDAVFVSRIHCGSADYDLDGLPDLAVSTPQFQNNELYRNLGGGSFVDVTAAAFPGLTLPLKQAQGLSWADYDDDGDPDLLTCGGNFPFWDFVALEGDSIRFYSRIDAGASKTIQFVTDADTVTIFAASSEFHPVDCFTGGGGASSTTYPLSVPVANLVGVPPALLTDADGVFAWSRPAAAGTDSVYVVLRAPPGDLLEIGGDVRGSAGPPLWWSSGFFLPAPPFALADWTNRLFRNNGNGTFAEVTSTAFAVNGPRVCSTAACWGDYDNDGRLDVFVANSGTVETKNQPDYLYRNNGDGTFTEVAALEGVQGPIAGMTDGGAWGDVNDDGFLDLFVNNGAEHPPFGIGQRQFFLNAPNGNHWMMLELQGIASNGSGIGSRIRFVSASGTRWRSLLGESDNGYAPFHGIHVGLGADAVCDTMEIHWPSGQIDTHVAVAADAKWFAIEGQALRPLANPTLVLGTTAVADTVKQDSLLQVPLPLSNSGGAAVHYTVTVEECGNRPAPWLSLDRWSGPLWPGSTPTLQLTVDPSTLPLGTACGLVLFTSNGSTSPDTVRVEVLVTDPDATGVEAFSLPTRFDLAPPRPNPTRRESMVRLALDRAAQVDVSVFDLAGHRVRRLAEGTLPAGFHPLVWDGADERGRRAAPGAYFVRAVAGAASRTQKLILLD